MRDWLQRSHIRARLREGLDEPHELLVHHHDESRALDLLLTLYWGLGIDHIKPEPVTRRALTLENSLLAAAIALVAATFALFAWLIIPVLAVVPLSSIGLFAAVAFVVVAAYPGRTTLRRDPFRPQSS